MVGDGGIIEFTEDGKTWSTQISGTNKLLYGLYFQSASVGWAVGEAGTILKTTNGGI